MIAKVEHGVYGISSLSFGIRDGLLVSFPSELMETRESPVRFGVMA
jgi:hypothetical protein